MVRFSIAILCIALSVGCAYDTNAQRGAVLGGLTGSALGAAIGEANDEPLAGAAIGAIAGTLTGTAIGDGVDQRQAQERATLAAQQAWSAQAVTPDQLVQMSQNGLSDDVIVTYVETHGVRFKPSANDLIALQQQGVSNRVLNAVQTSSTRVPVIAAPQPARPVVVQEHYYAPVAPACPPYGWYPRHRRRYCPPPSGSSFGFSFSSR